MNSQTILFEIAQYRATHSGEVPALIVVDGNTAECIDYATLVARSEANDAERLCDEYAVFVINHNLPDFYNNNFPVLVNKYTKTNIKDYLFYLLEAETRPQ